MNRSIKEIIQTGETETVEFKKNFDSSAIITINAFSNTKGGKVLIGVKDDGSIFGIEKNSETIQNWIYPIR